MSKCLVLISKGKKFRNSKNYKVIYCAGCGKQGKMPHSYEPDFFLCSYCYVA